MTIPSRFENLLTSASARRYMVNRFSVTRAWTEVEGSADRLSVILGEDMTHFHEMRVAVRKALSAQPDQQMAAASLWKSFLKPRIEILEHWSSVTGAFAAFCSGVLAVGYVSTRSLGSIGNVYLLVSGMAAAGLALVKLLLDRHKCWYRYLVAHLEAIEKAPQR